MIFLSLGLGQLLMMGLSDMSQVIAVMVLIISMGYTVDGLVFKTMETRLERKWGLLAAT